MCENICFQISIIRTGFFLFLWPNRSCGTPTVLDDNLRRLLNSCPPCNQWCHHVISSAVTCFSSCFLIKELKVNYLSLMPTCCTVCTISLENTECWELFSAYHRKIFSSIIEFNWFEESASNDAGHRHSQNKAQTKEKCNPYWRVILEMQVVYFVDPAANWKEWQEGHFYKN